MIVIVMFLRHVKPKYDNFGKLFAVRGLIQQRREAKMPVASRMPASQPEGRKPAA